MSVQLLAGFTGKLAFVLDMLHIFGLIVSMQIVDVPLEDPSIAEDLATLITLELRPLDVDLSLHLFVSVQNYLSQWVRLSSQLFSWNTCVNMTFC